MEHIVKCYIVIYDDFNNVLIAERGKGKNVIKKWGIFGKELKGKETDEKCLLKAIDKDIKCTVFDLNSFKNYKLNNDSEELRVYTGTIKEYITCHKTINSIKWISKNQLENFTFKEEEKQILKDFFYR